MKKTKVYIFKKKGLAFEIIFGCVSFLPLVFILIYLIDSPVVALLLSIAPCAFLYFQIYAILVINQYNKIDNNKQVTISADRLTLSIEQDNIITTINSSNVTEIDIYEGVTIGKFTNLSYIMINTNDGKEFIITELTVHQLAFDNALQSFLRKKPRAYFKKNFNFIVGQPIW